MTGYSDRTNHALAFAAKHHDRQVHKGARAPYRTTAANVAIILTRYGQSEETVLAGILSDAIEDHSRERMPRETLEQRIGQKFGTEALDLVLAVSPRPVDDSGLELSRDEARDDVLERLAKAPDGARWVFAARLLHDASSLLADLRRTIDPDSVWSGLPLGRDGTSAWYRRAADRLRQVGFIAPITTELEAAVGQLESHAGRGA